MENKKSNIKSDTIYYDFNRKLSWEDFQGKPDTNHFGGAVTASGFAFNSEMSYDDRHADLVIHVYTFFSKHDSWKKSNINSDYHLLHEQHHFDITRIGAQRFIEEIKKAHFTRNNYNRLINAIFNKVYNENMVLQEQYDFETRNSINIKKQEEWNERIADEIKKLKEKQPRQQ